MSVALQQAATITIIVVAAFAFLALLALIRVVLRGDARWRRYRLGVFVERDVDDGDNGD